MLRDALAERRLLRLRCMRQTLHLVPPGLAPVVHRATLSQRLGHCRLALQRSGVGARTWVSLRAAVAACVDGRELPYRHLEREALARGPRTIRRHSDAVLLTRLAIKSMWEEGQLLVGDASPSLHHEHRTFALTAQALPSLDLDALPPAEAIARLLPRYLEGYGPASVRDFQWWSGIGLAEGLPAWQRLEHRLVCVRVAGRPADGLVALDCTVAALLEGPWAGCIAAADARVLAYEDPALRATSSAVGAMPTRPA